MSRCELPRGEEASLLYCNGMANELEKDGLRHLKRIERELGEIRDRTGSPKRAFVNGILYGAGAFIGGVVAVALIGWLLSFLGVIPGLNAITDYLQSLIRFEA